MPITNFYTNLLQTIYNKYTTALMNINKTLIKCNNNTLQ